MISERFGRVNCDDDDDDDEKKVGSCSCSLYVAGRVGDDVTSGYDVNDAAADGVDRARVHISANV